MSLRLIVGLGNPGNAYEKTRHNAGFWFIQALFEQFPTSQALKFQKKFNALVGEVNIESQRYFLMQPQTYMNESGQAIAKCIKFYKILPEQLLVVHDDLDFPVGKIYLKWGGGHGGHNGLRNIIQHIGADFWRLRLGIGHPQHKDLVHDYVLMQPPGDQKQQIEQSIGQIISFMPDIVQGKFEQVMCQLHTQSH